MDSEQLIRLTWIKSEELSSYAVSDTASHPGNRNQGHNEIVVKEEHEELAVKEEREEIAVKEAREEIAVKEERDEIVVKEEREEIAVKEEREEIAVKEEREEIAVKEEQRSTYRGPAAGPSSDTRGVQSCKMAATLQLSSSTDDENNTPECLNISKSKHCYMHITWVKHEEVNYFTTTRWNTYRTSLQKWLGLKGESRDVAENFKHCVDVEFDNIPEDAGFHHTCYCRFTNKTTIAKVERRLAHERQKAMQDHEAIPLTSSSTSPTKKRRSWSGLPIESSGPVLPAQCIICQKKEKLINRAGKRQRDPLSKAETLTAGQLQKAAELKDDQSILIHIKDKDCVALEVQYHKGCYNQYTRFLTRHEKQEKEQNEPMFDVSYKVFCERIIRQRLLVNKEVLRMGQLRKTFIELVKSNEGLDASNYRQDMLKKRLTRDFPQLVFHIPTKRNICELVFVETLSTDALVDMLPYPSGAETTQSSELSQTDSETEKGTTQEDARTLNTAALLLKRHLSDTPGMSCPWPPTSENLNVTEAQNVVPLGLYNLVSCIIGATDETTLDHYVNIADDLHLKVLSVCQDIVYLASRGRKQTPKSLQCP